MDDVKKEKSPCYGCKYQKECGSPREGHPCEGREPVEKKRIRIER